MLHTILGVSIDKGPLYVTLLVLSVGLFAVLLIRPKTSRWLIVSTVSLMGGAIVALLAWLILVDTLGVVRIPLSHEVYLLFTATVSGVVLALVNIWKSRWWRKLAAGAAMVVFLAAGTLAINATFGMYRTVGELFGVSSLHPIALAPLSTLPAPLFGQLWKTWRPPADMPPTGTTGTVVIPNTLSGFAARPAGIYMPPAALVANPPKLPLVVLMMGQPGAPDPQYVASVLDRLAAKHFGLAPIVVVADQLGDPNIDNLCLDSQKYGNVETYITKDVVNWATKNLNVTQDHRLWTVAGYSHGGQCAISFIAKHPRLWSNVLDVSGEEYPGSDSPGGVLRDFFGGDQAAYDRQKPSTILTNTKLPDTFGVFTVGSNDSAYIPGTKRTVAAASSAGMQAVYYETPNGGHVLPALTDGLAKGFELLYPLLGLAARHPAR